MPAEPHVRSARRRARRTASRPIDYMRYGEYQAVLTDLDLVPGMDVLDVSSPQWFSVHLAATHPDVRFTYLNISERELAGFGEIAAVLGLDNITYMQGDVRELQFDGQTFDRVVSISVIEHVSPEEGGDTSALREVERVLRPSGELLMTVPYKSEGAIVHVDGPVNESGERERHFFAREYDERSLGSLIKASGLDRVSAWYISERKGVLSVDYYEWGPGKATPLSYPIRYRRLVELLVGRSADGLLARRYLVVAREPLTRLVNIAVRLRKGATSLTR
jgi:SAM-dependent methyltransferase